MIYKSHYLTFETISDYHSSKFLPSNDPENKKSSIDEINKYDHMLFSYTNNYVTLLKNKIRLEDEPTKIEKSQPR